VDAANSRRTAVLTETVEKPEKVEEVYERRNVVQRTITERHVLLAWKLPTEVTPARLRRLAAKIPPCETS
jgi:hypothetical protein